MAEQQSRWDSPRTRRAVAVAGVAAVLGIAAILLLWFNCGLRGCPDVDLLRGYVPDEASSVVDRNGEEISKLYLVRRVVVPLDSLPEHVGQAFIAVEDRRFREHGGVDLPRVLGAAWTNIRSASIQEGFSTITMQLAGNLYPERLSRQERTLWRKIGEMRVAREIEEEYTKDEILEMYMNQIFYGYGAWGIQAAAEEYFAKPASELTLPEAATLAGLPAAPSRLNPRANPDLARERRNLVIDRMEEQGMVEPERAEEARESPIEVAPRRQTGQDEEGAAPYFVEEVRKQLEQELGAALYTEGYTIHTTLDLDAQRVLEEELQRQVRDIEAGRYGPYPHPAYQGGTGGGGSSRTPYLQGAAVIMEVSTGDIAALIGGRDFEDSEYNRATQAERQPGSAFKPFVYATALARGYPPTHPLEDTPLRMTLDNGQVWEPRNYEDDYDGRVSLREGLVRSKNVATVRLATEVGISEVVRTANLAGIDGDLPSYPAVALGSFEVTLLDLVGAYTTFASLGSTSEPRLVTRVEDRAGRTVHAPAPRSRRTMDPAVAFLVTDLLQDVVNRGTATAVRAAGYNGPVAGKTGTTNDGADVWFIGYTPERVAGIWIGLDDPQQIVSRATGGRLAAPVWGRAMSRLPQSGAGGWSPPPGVERREVDMAGNPVGEGCPTFGETRGEFFLAGASPPGDCYGWENDTLWGDSLALPDSLRGPEDEEWWARMRERLFGEDTTDLSPEERRERLDSLRRVRLEELGDTLGEDTIFGEDEDTAAEEEQDTVPPEEDEDTTELIGEPVDSLRR